MSKSNFKRIRWFMLPLKQKGQTSNTFHSTTGKPHWYLMNNWFKESCMLFKCIKFCYFVSYSSKNDAINFFNLCIFSRGNVWKKRRKMLNPVFFTPNLRDKTEMINRNGHLLVGNLLKYNNEASFNILKCLKVCAFRNNYGKCIFNLNTNFIFVILIWDSTPQNFVSWNT